MEEEEEKKEEENEDEEAVDEEMAEGSQVGGSKGGGPRKGGWGGWLALLICKTANLRTLCLPALSSSLRSPHSPPPPSLRTVDLLSLSPLPSLTFSPSLSSSFTFPLPVSLSRSLFLFLYLYFDSSRLPRSRLFLNPRKTHSHRSTLSLSRSRRPSHSPAFPHPCGTSRKLYVPTLATLNAGLARDNPRPSPPPSTPAASPPSSSSSSSPTARRPTRLCLLCPFSLRAGGPPGFTTG